MSTKNNLIPRIPMSINPDNLSVAELNILERVAPVLDFQINNINGYSLVINHNENQKLVVSFDYESSKFHINYDSLNGFARALSYLRDVYENGNYILESLAFEDLGFMLDASRNAVPTVDSVKLLLNDLAILGFNVLLLYLEDIYELNSYPYFGYQRGAYTQKELKEIDAYADKLGIEVIPCIQTLAHLQTTLRWPYAREFKDVDEILLVGEEKSYKLIQAMLDAFATCFRTNRIHLGMDEAFGLGRGQYLDKNGYEIPYKIFQAHLSKVLDLCKTLGFEPMIWSDMYFRFASPKHDYYDTTAPISPEIKQSIPNGVNLVYWDYYHEDTNIYKEMFNRHKEVSNSDIWFAGGLWTWNGIKVNHGKAIQTSLAAINAAKDMNIKHAFVTAWGDNGAETSIFEALLDLQYFAEVSWNNTPIVENVIYRYSQCFGADGQAYYNMRLFDEVPGVDLNNPNSYNPSKYILYSDPLLGLFDAHILPKANELNEHYAELADYFDEIANNCNDQNRLFYLQSAQLADVLQRKVMLVQTLRRAYLENDTDILNQIVDYYLPELIAATADLQAFTMSIWYLHNKPQGSEIIDSRFGAQIARLKTTLDRLEGYLNGVYDSIAELEEKRLAFDGRDLIEVEKRPHISVNNYRDIISANPL